MNDKGNTRTLADVVRNLLHSPKVKKKYFQAKIKMVLESSFKGYYKEYFQSITLKNNTLILRISSSVLRNELMLRKNELMNKLNKELGENYVLRIEIY